MASGLFEATTDYTRLKEWMRLSSAFPPLNEFREPDLGAVDATADAIAKNLCQGQLIVLKVPLIPVLRKSGFVRNWKPGG